ncbi:MAG TPA: DoxX family protein [Acidobacteriaceae bacterium]|nr:DoxX family protein [Acidobacteriaceae bacterium]
METTMPAAAPPGNAAVIGSGRLWTGRVITGLITLFMVFDAAMKFAKPKPVADAFVRTGWPIDLSVTLGVILAVSTIFYLIPRTAVVGAILLTGYLGGAVATNLRLHNPLFGNTLFPVYFGVLVWAALWLRDPAIAHLIPTRQSS